jgi:hypothetical protein
VNRAPTLTATCSCGCVEVQAFGNPIVSGVCYCGDCQKGGAQIEALPNAAAVRDADGGTACILYPKDRIACAKGADLLRPYKLRAESVTNRVVATCCNSAMFMNFDKGPFWVSAYRARFRGDLPPIEVRICTKSKPEGVVLPGDVPSHPGYPPRMMVKLLMAGAAMLFRR